MSTLRHRHRHRHRHRAGALALGLALAAAILGLVAWRTAGEAPAAPRTGAAPARTLAVAPGVTVRPAAAPRHAGVPVVAPAPGRGHAGVSTDDPLTAYRKLNVYPPASRPLTREQTDLLRPGERHEQRRPTDADDGVDFLFTADRYFVFGDEAIAPSLDVRRDGKPIPVTITQAFAAVIEPGNRAPARFPFELRGGSPLRGAFAPSMMRLSRQAAIGLYVEFDYGGARQRARIEFQYTPSAGIPARFTGSFQDAAANGSLVVRAGVTVVRGGHYVIDCNLYDAEDRPVAWTRSKVELTESTREVELSFFGKVLTDQGARGPFKIGQLRGARFDPGRDPDLEQMPPYAGSYTTRAYPASAFSDAEYDSPDKQRMLRFLAEQQAKGVHQAGARPADPGTPGDDK
jgi:hypothetical protein